MAFEGRCRSTGIGSLPFEDVDEAVHAVLEFCPDLPYWPQLPKRSHLEGMNEQMAENFPGLSVRDGTMALVQDDDFFGAAAQLMEAFDDRQADVGAMSADYAAGFDPFVEAARTMHLVEAKGQISGPVTFGMSVLDDQGVPILFDPVMQDLLVKHLWLKVYWQRQRFVEAGWRAVIFVDEPFLASFGTAFFHWTCEQVRDVLEQVYSAAEVTGTHCCSNTDWSIFLDSSVDIVSLDAFGFADDFLLYQDSLTRFLLRGGNIAWGLVPTDPEPLEQISAGEMVDRLEGLVDRIAALGVARDRVLRQSLITPACGLGTRSPETARRALTLTRDIAQALQHAHASDLA